ncbi:MAG: DNA starvation/stationary phase protection protein [Prevotellaceae bacterium]|jgi:starvation-inducible DNA-binding protein|nr:DNA starvation/stationary phase protection protein [Prevotellaceae bacterium]
MQSITDSQGTELKGQTCCNGSSVLDFTGICKDGASALVSKLGELLANLQVCYTNVRGFHWTITGHSFFTLHSKFEDQYNDLAEKIDEVAERILTLGGIPENNFSKYLQVSSIKEVTGVCCGKAAVTNILESYKVIIAIEKEIMELANSAKDEATLSLISDYLKAQEKTVWMFVAYLKG